MRSLATEMAPPFALVAHFFIAAVVFLLLSTVALFEVYPDLSGYGISFSLASFAHLYLLGFVMMVIFGAMYQLLPVVLEIPLFSKDFAYVQFYAYVIGLGMMVLGFRYLEWHLLIAYGGFLTYMSIAIFCVNVFLTFYRLEKNSIVSSYLLMGTVFLAVAVTLGILLGFVLAHGMLSIDIDAWVKAHVIGTLFGFVMMIVMGVSMVLIPMFSLAHGFKDRYIHAALFLHGIGVSVAILALVAALPTVVLYAGLGSVFISMGLYLFQMGIIFSVRVRKQNDYWVKNLFFSFLSLIGAMVMLLLFFIEAQERYLFAAAELFFFGFLLAFIVGHLYKILPFLIWYKTFSPLVGKQKVPLLHQMVHTKSADIQAFLLFISVVCLSIATLLPLQVLFYGASLGVMSSVVLVAFNVVYAFTYKGEN